jgi:hypothetical protein
MKRLSLRNIDQCMTFRFTHDMGASFETPGLWATRRGFTNMFPCCHDDLKSCFGPEIDGIDFDRIVDNLNGSKGFESTPGRYCGPVGTGESDGNGQSTLNSLVINNSG